MDSRPSTLLGHGSVLRPPLPLLCPRMPGKPRLVTLTGRVSMGLHVLRPIEAGGFARIPSGQNGEGYHV